MTSLRWSLFGLFEERVEIDDDLRTRFLSYADGEGNKALMRREGLRNLLECTDSFCMAKHWLPESYVDKVFSQYASGDGIGLKEFAKLARDGLLLQGKVQEYERAFVSLDADGDGFLTRDELGKLFAGLGRIMSPAELDKTVDDADVGHDGIDLADFLFLARDHLDLKEVLKHVATQANIQEPASLPVDLGSPVFTKEAGLGRVTEVHSFTELDAILKNGADAVVKLAFTWCKPCKAFWPKYLKYAKLYSNTRFLKIVGNENESCKHYARDVLHAKISPMFAVYSKGELVKTWTGANNERFITNMEECLPSAGALAEERRAAIIADPGLAPKK